jgi:hypothetical protein
MNSRLSVLAPAATAEQLERRVRDVLASYSRGELAAFLTRLGDLGDLAIFGGVLRDVALQTPSEFKSDIDIVVIPKHERQFDRFFEKQGAASNKFGGYRIQLSRGSVDAWPLARTWAFRTGLRRGDKLSDLLGTTYYSWDSIAYWVQRGMLYCRPTYLADIAHRVIDLELPENPNPLGIIVRTLRLLATASVSLRWGLAMHTRSILQQHEADSIVEYERGSYKRMMLSREGIMDVKLRLDAYASGTTTADFRLNLPQRQIELMFEGVSPAEALLAPRPVIGTDPLRVSS